MNRKTPTLIGAGVGLATFLAIALLPALLYGGYAGVLLAGGIFGTPVQATFGVRALIVFAMVMGVTGVGALFTVGGAVPHALASDAAAEGVELADERVHRPAVPAVGGDRLSHRRAIVYVPPACRSRARAPS